MSEFERLATPEEILWNNVRDLNEYKNKPFESQFVIGLKNILMNGTPSDDRTGTGTKRIQSQQIHIDMANEFPILQAKH